MFDSVASLVELNSDALVGWMHTMALETSTTGKGVSSTKYDGWGCPVITNCEYYGVPSPPWYTAVYTRHPSNESFYTIKKLQRQNNSPEETA